MTDLDITAIREETCEPTWPRGMCGAPQDMYAAPIVKALRAEIARSRAVVERLQGELDAQQVEWSVRATRTGRIEPAMGESLAKTTADEYAGYEVVSRKVTRWLPVPTDGAEN